MEAIKNKENFLIRLVKKYYTQGDEYSASLNKNGKWFFGYSNDYPMQHGNGENFTLPDKIVTQLFDEREALLEALQEMVRMYEIVEPAGGWQGVYETAKYAIERANK